ncbi:hypothetical protein BUALT_Bualt16G0079600 [Buddleja alternifolia]|uniref:Reverse transcriptase domain-containing protein n=1 Tax=Buddleja alternifolia TaxID=168488 RepID=A0AAV6WGJ0_9LAMI|nr:hypothetical protein BUALT_Bualt16G0079600 [Buddleja alternifolia]
MWIRDPSCKDTVSGAWWGSGRGSPPFILHSKIKTTRSALLLWNRVKFGREKTIENYRLEMSPVKDLNELLKREEAMWRQQAKQKWIEEGDANTRFFHLSTIIHRRYNTIFSLRDSNNFVISSWHEKGVLFDNYFKEHFSTCHPSYPHDLESLIPNLVTNEDNENLLSIPSPLEIKQVVFSMSSNKTPGSDRMSPSFFKSYWSIVGEDVTKAVIHFFEIGNMLKALNHTFIALIPEMRRPMDFSTIVNGSPFGFFRSSRVIRQGDPLSPYLILVYFDLLSRMIFRAELSNQLQGIKISRNSPTISHLMYADDLLIFSEASILNVECIQNINEKYELVRSDGE